LFFDIVKSLGIDSSLYEIPKYDLVDDMKLWPPVTFPDVYCYLIETPGDFTWKKSESIQLCDFRLGQATTGAEFLLRQPSSLDFCPSPFLTRVWGYHDGKIV